jgi:hypothetical protein
LLPVPVCTRGKLSTPVRDNEQAAAGALTLDLQSSVLPRFDNYFRTLTPARNIRNPWFKEYWQHVHNCRLPDADIRHSSPTNTNGTRRLCDSSDRIPGKYTQENKVQFVVNAVYALVHAMRRLVLTSCDHEVKGSPAYVACAKNATMNGERLYAELLNVSFTGTSELFIYSRLKICF